MLESIRKKKIFKVSKFLDFDKYQKIFYNNFYIDDIKFVVKMPLVDKEKAKKDFKIEKFDLAKYTYLLSYD